jgi:predicted amidohydrolase
MTPPSQMLRVAAAQYDIGYLPDWDWYSAKIAQWVNAAVADGSELLVFPEYFSMELASLFPEAVYRSLSRQLAEMQSLLDDFTRLFATLAERHRAYIVAGSFPVRQQDDSYRNRSFFFTPTGGCDYQDKLMMTRFENEQWLISVGEEIKVFDTAYGGIGINICYDSEFPMIARHQVERGANLILVPSCTDTVAGYFRVRIGCQARALENQCYVVQSPTVGEASWSEAVDVNIGAAGFYTPVDYGFPEDGILQIGDRDRPQWVYADLDLQSIAKIRNTGQVFNYRDWPAQFRAL